MYIYITKIIRGMKYKMNIGYNHWAWNKSFTVLEGPPGFLI